MAITPTNSPGASIWATVGARRARALLAIVLTGLIFYLLLKQVDGTAVVAALRGAEWTYLLLALLLLGLTVVTGVERWRLLLADFLSVGFCPAVRAFLAAGSTNILMPSKLGDFTRVYFLRRELAGRLDTTDLLSVGSSVALEKLLDLSALCLVLVVGSVSLGHFDRLTISVVIFAAAVLSGVLFVFVVDFRQFFDNCESRSRNSHRLRKLALGIVDYVQKLRRRRGRLALFVSLSVTQWLLHMAQMVLILQAVGAREVPISAVVALVPVALLAGLIPLTLGGMGTRDAALLLLLRPYAPDAQLLAGILLFTLRYWLLSFLGLPFLRRGLRAKNPQPDEPAASAR